MGNVPGAEGTPRDGGCAEPPGWELLHAVRRGAHPLERVFASITQEMYPVAHRFDLAGPTMSGIDISTERCLDWRSGSLQSASPGALGPRGNG